VEHARSEYGVDLIAEPETGQYDAVVLAVAHGEFVAMGADRIRSLGTPGAVLFDVKRALPRASVDGCL
jgi:UDP-N-acetyl-D-galactosamine dehydrogenase